MRLKKQVMQDGKVLIAEVSGNVNNRHLFRHSLVRQKEYKPTADHRQLVDLRRVECMKGLTVRGVTQYAKLETARPEGLLALLIPDSPLHLGMARVYQTFAQERWGYVEIFTRPDFARAWVEMGVGRLTVAP